MSILRDIPS